MKSFKIFLASLVKESFSISKYIREIREMQVSHRWSCGWWSIRKQLSTCSSLVSRFRERIASDSCWGKHAFLVDVIIGKTILELNYNMNWIPEVGWFLFYFHGCNFCWLQLHILEGPWCSSRKVCVVFLAIINYETGIDGVYFGGSSRLWRVRGHLWVTNSPSNYSIARFIASYFQITSISWVLCCV